MSYKEDSSLNSLLSLALALSACVQLWATSTGAPARTGRSSVRFVGSGASSEADLR